MTDGQLLTTTPTLLIGLGGIGSRVVDQVYGMLPAGERDRVLVHAFDTNVNDIQKLQHLRGRVTQTSTDLTVGQYLQQAGPLVQEWFPKAAPELKRKTLTEGAGMIRVVSRLAYRSAIEQGKLARLEKQVSDLFLARPDDTTYSPRVMIVNSLAGGTGGGIFLQVAMYIRWLLEKILRRVNIYVRGAFLLPEVLTKTGTLKDIQDHANTQANGYACLKELDAIVANARAAGESSVTIELEFRPGQRDDSGRPDFAITPQLLPYDFTFLFDFNNTTGHNLKHLVNYERQMAKVIYLQLFSPMAGPSFSVEDNNILRLIAAAGRNRYCGAGVSTLYYPYEDILAYLALCWVTEALSTDWLRLDEDYQQELRQYERDLQAGINRNRPDLGDRYVSLLQNYGSDDSALPFFKQVHRSCHILDQHGRPERRKADLYVAAVEEFIAKILAEDQELAQAEEDCAYDEGRIHLREHAAREVEQRETALQFLQQKVLAKVQEHKVFIVNQALWYDCDVPGHRSGQPYQLNTWLLGGDEPLHPVAVRAVLYQIHRLLQGKVRSLQADNQRKLADIHRYAEIYNIDDPEDKIEDAQERIRLALQQGVVGRLFRNQFKEFIEEYIEKSTRQLHNLKTYKVAKLQELVFAEVAQQIRIMLDGWELFFRNLRETRNELLAQRNTRRLEHEGTADPTQVFVLAGAERKESLWQELKPQLISASLSPELTKEMYLGQYAHFCQQRFQRGTALPAPDTTRFFQEKILVWCQKQLRDRQELNLSIFRALQKEAALSGRVGEADVQDYVETKIRGLLPLAQPFVPRFNDAREILYWGVNEETAGALTQEQRLDLFGGQEIAHRAFSPYELICYRCHYGFKAEDFPDFAAGDPDRGLSAGVYFQAYRDRIRLLERLRDQEQDERTVTPHLDKRWHLPAYMPDLNERQMQIEQEKIERALILGLIHGLFRVAREDRQASWVYAGPAGLRAVRVGGNTIPGDLHRLHAALAHNPAMVDLVLEEAEKRKREDIEHLPAQVAQHRFTLGCQRPPGILESILVYSQAAPSDPSLPEKSAALLSRLLEEIVLYAQACHGDQVRTANAWAADLITALRSQSPSYTAAAQESTPTRQFLVWQELLEGKLRELG